MDELEKQAEKKESESNSSKSEESNSEDEGAENVECEEGEDARRGWSTEKFPKIPTGGAGYVQTYHELTRPFYCKSFKFKKSYR